MTQTPEPWKKWTPPYDPRRGDGATVYEDEHGRLIETADCALRCPGCGICCAGYRDVVTDEYQGVEEFELNLRAITARGGLVRVDEGQYYRGAHCGPDCPGYDRCCPPFGQRDRPANVADARKVLLERDDSMRWEMQEALLILAHDGSDEAVEILEAFMPQAHVRLVGFAECALDEGRFFNTVPHNEFEERQMMKGEVLQHYEDLVIEAQTTIEEEIQPRLARQRYELSVFQRLHDKTENEQARDDWRIQIDVQEMVIGHEEGHLDEWQADIARYEAIIAEIEADLQQETTASEDAQQ
ncbi:MAG: hypothetical protein KJ638_06700 [Chloroflexi bacterium]|nr:hypothetical protein [Chloroflexota bacterium]